MNLTKNESYHSMHQKEGKSHFTFPTKTENRGMSQLKTKRTILMIQTRNDMCYNMHQKGGNNYSTFYTRKENRGMSQLTPKRVLFIKNELCHNTHQKGKNSDFTMYIKKNHVTTYIDKGQFHNLNQKGQPCCVITCAKKEKTVKFTSKKGERVMSHLHRTRL